eukprot:11711075-Alexandrium_andersonii.AAC.1
MACPRTFSCSRPTASSASACPGTSPRSGHVLGLGEPQDCFAQQAGHELSHGCLLYTSPSPRD